MNRITNESFRFFGLEVELWRIGESPEAPKFNIVSKPNNWSRSVAQAARTIDDSKLSPIAVMQRAYWDALHIVLNEVSGPVSGNGKAQSRFWIAGETPRHGAPGVEGVGIEPALVGASRTLRRVGAVLCERARKRERHLRVVGRLSGDGVPATALGEFTHTIRIGGADGCRRLELDQAAESVAGKLTEQTALSAGDERSDVGDTQGLFVVCHDVALDHVGQSGRVCGNS